MDYDLLPFPAEREIIVDSGYLAARRHIVYGLVEIDVTRPRKIMQALSAREGDKLSFTAYIVACFARAIAASPQVQAYRDWRGRLVVFHDVDVVTLVEPEPGAVAIPHVVRFAQRKTVQEISAEIRSVKYDPATSAQGGGLTALAPRLPRFARLLFFWALKKDPHWFKRLAGTAVVTSVGMFGKGGGWGIAFLPYHTLGLTVGGIAQKPGAYAGKMELRQVLSLTIAFDHDVVDGAPAARFSRGLVELIESGAALEGEPGSPGG